MKKGLCPKCNSKEVYRGVGYPQQKEMITISGTMLVKCSIPDKYVCTSCGYVELYLTSEVDLDDIREKWEKV